ncbi:DUF4113 domain-containing protein [Providencia alcalifaciens]|nr:DUF4113 domain-containing protein [Providencia alcalifaciens]NYS91704.1 DUF4113 domain-containing protein [Providencia alcalifaciens]
MTRLIAEKALSGWQGMQSQSALWKMKQQFLSPRWTTQFSDIPVVKC